MTLTFVTVLLFSSKKKKIPGLSIPKLFFGLFTKNLSLLDAQSNSIKRPFLNAINGGPNYFVTFKSYNKIDSQNITMKDFIGQCNELSFLDSTSKADLNNVLKVRRFKKGESILYNGDICRHIFFINSGLVKVFSYKEDKEFIMRFFSEDQLFSVFDSYFMKTPSRFTISALENTTVTLIGYEDMARLSERHHAIETFYRKITADTTVRMTKRINEMLEEDTTERYHNFVSENNTILQRISLGDLAKYLGITQQSLSRIRTRK